VCVRRKEIPQGDKRCVAILDFVSFGLVYAKHIDDRCWDICSIGVDLKKKVL
jgi:hypothetical protein